MKNCSGEAGSPEGWAAGASLSLERGGAKKGGDPDVRTAAG